MPLQTTVTSLTARIRFSAICLDPKLIFSLKELTIKPGPLLPAEKMPCLRNGRSSIFLMPTEYPGSAKAVSCKQESLRSQKRPRVWRSSVSNIRFLQETSPTTGWGDATDSYHVGDQILVRITHVSVTSVSDITVKADVKSVIGNASAENLKKCKVQGKYIGTVTDIHKGTVFIRLSIGVNAVAHSCYDSRLPGKKDEVSFVVTRIDSERNVAVGLISRIVKQNI